MTVSQKQQSLFLVDALSDEPEIRFVPDFVENHTYWFQRLQQKLQWNHQYRSRKYYSFGTTYNYKSGKKQIRQLPTFLHPVCKRIEFEFGYYPNNCLANYYPGGNNYISFHSDQDMEMKANSGVTIVSLGSVRTMALRRIDDIRCRHYYPLLPGSAFFMEDRIQKEWQHGILKEAGSGPRISLSFRQLLV